jgi:hypothetical protein
MAGDELIVKPQNIIDYSSALTGEQSEVLELPGKLQPVSESTRQAFSPVQAGVRPIPEADWMSWAMADIATQYGQFMQDLSLGWMAMSNSSAVCAIGYAHADAETAERNGLIDYAFDRNGGQAPPGIPTDLVGKSMSDAQAEYAGTARPDSVFNPGAPVRTESYSTAVVSTYADGSQRVTSRAFDDGGYGNGLTTATYDANGHLITSSTSFTAADGSTKTIETVSTGPGPQYNSTAVTERRRTGNTITVTRTATVPVTDQEGKVTQETRDPVVTQVILDENSAAPTREVGPVEQYADDHPDRIGDRDNIIDNPYAADFEGDGASPEAAGNDTDATRGVPAPIPTN